MRKGIFRIKPSWSPPPSCTKDTSTGSKKTLRTGIRKEPMQSMQSENLVHQSGPFAGIQCGDTLLVRHRDTASLVTVTRIGVRALEGTNGEWTYIISIVTSLNVTWHDTLYLYIRFAPRRISIFRDVVIEKCALEKETKMASSYKKLDSTATGIYTQSNQKSCACTRTLCTASNPH
jgi:hypothetical protein